MNIPNTYPVPAGPMQPTPEIGIRPLRFSMKGIGMALSNLLDNSAVITPPGEDPVFVDLQCRASDYEAAYVSLNEADEKDGPELARIREGLVRLRDTTSCTQMQYRLIDELLDQD